MKKSISSVIFLSLLFNVFSLFAMKQEIVLEDERIETKLIDLPDDVLNYVIMSFLISNDVCDVRDNAQVVKNIRLSCSSLKDLVDNFIVQVDINDYKNGAIRGFCGAHPLKLEKIRDLIKNLRAKIPKYNVSLFVIGDKNNKKGVILNKDNAKYEIYKFFEQFLKKPYCLRLREYHLRGVMFLLSFIVGACSGVVFWKNMSHLKLVYILLFIVFLVGFSLADITFMLGIYAYDIEVEECLDQIYRSLFRIKKRERKFNKKRKSLERVVKISFLDA